MKAKQAALQGMKDAAIKALAKRLASKMGKGNGVTVGLEVSEADEPESLMEAGNEDRADEIAEGVGPDKTAPASEMMDSGHGLSPEEHEALKKYYEENC